MFRGGAGVGGRGFLAGWAGLLMIIIALVVILACCCCWCYELAYKRRRRMSLEEHMDNERLREESPKFLKLLASKENARRASCASTSDYPVGLVGYPVIKKCEVIYSGAVSPYQAQTSLNNIPRY